MRASRQNWLNSGLIFVVGGNVQLFGTPWAAVCQAPLSSTISQNLLKFIFIESVMLSNYLIVCCPLILAPSIFPGIRVFAANWLFSSGAQNFGASATILPMIIQGWFPLGLTGLISLQSIGLLIVFSSTTIWKHRFFGAQPSLWSNSHIDTWLLEKP